MKRIRLRTVFIFVLGVLAGSLLLRTSQDVQDAEHQLQSLQAQMEAEQEAIRVLKAEWEYLNSPIRLEALAGEFLPELQAPESEQMMEEPPEWLKYADPFLVKGEDLEEVQEDIVKPQPVSFGGEAEKKVPPQPRSKPKPHKDFNALLSDLSNGGAE